jgi:uncharacterized membrane protein YqjE
MPLLESNGASERPVPSVIESLDRVVDAAQNVVGDEVNLLRVEVSSAVSTALLGGAMLSVGMALMLVGWVIVLMIIFQMLAPRLGGLGTMVALAALNLVPGIALLVQARHELARIRHG